MADAVFHPATLASRVDLKPRFRWLAALVRSLKRATIAEDTRRTLDELPDNLLRDIGLTRPEIPFIAGELLSGPRMSVQD